MIENIKLSFQGIWSHKLRSFLTMLGIIIGIASIIAIVSTILGTNKQIEQNLIGSGDKTVKVQVYQGDYPMEFSYEGIPEGLVPISKDVQKQLQEIKDVTSVSFYTSRQEYEGVSYLGQMLQGGVVYGVDQAYFNASSYIMKQGRGFTNHDYQKYHQVAVVDENAAETLGCKVGSIIEIKGSPFTVVGIASPLNHFEPVIHTVEDYYMYQTTTAGNIYVTHTTWPIIYGYDEPEKVLLKVDETSAMTSVGKKASDLLNAAMTISDENITFKAENLLEQAKQIQQLSQSTNMMLVWIAGISLFVGGIGVMNIMLVSVTERTNEIGLKKAIGARKNTILFQFLTEAVVLTSLGGICGVAVGLLLGKVIGTLNAIPVVYSVPASILAVLFSMTIGIVFGLIPASKAANLDPIEALRHE